MKELEDSKDESPLLPRGGWAYVGFLFKSFLPLLTILLIAPVVIVIVNIDYWPASVFVYGASILLLTFNIVGDILVKKGDTVFEVSIQVIILHILLTIFAVSVFGNVLEITL